MEGALAAARPDDYAVYTLENVRTIGKFCTNYDGDTADFLLVIDGKIQRHRVRMMGYDSPEMKPALSDPKREEKKAAALVAKARLAELCGVPGSVLYVQCHGGDKYGRQLVSVYRTSDYAGLSINQQMIDEGHGYAYFGGKKE